MSYSAALFVLNIPVYFALGYLCFGDWETFFDNAKYLFIPNLFSALRGELWDDWWASISMFGFFFLCGLVVASEHWWLEGHQPWPGWIAALFGLLGYHVSA